MKIIYGITIVLITFHAFAGLHTANAAFRFGSTGDTQGSGTPIPAMSGQMATHNPALLFINGDFEGHGFSQSGTQQTVTGLGNLWSKTFAVRGNHDNQLANPDQWTAFHDFAAKVQTIGATNYTELEPDRTYSFDYDNSRFIGVDIPGDVKLMTTTQIAWIDQRLADATSKGLTHAFLFWHGPFYCVDGHCSCSSTTDATCSPQGLISVINKHPIVSATFHGHEHVLTWTHLSNTRLTGLTQPFEQFTTSPGGSGSFYSSNLIPARYDFADKTNSQAFGIVEVNGTQFTVSLYRVGTTAAVWSKTFTKGSAPPPDTLTPTQIHQGSPTPSPTPGGSIKPGDLEPDGDVDIYDYNQLVSDFGKTGTAGWIPADIIKNGKVDIYDFNALVTNFGK